MLFQTDWSLPSSIAPSARGKEPLKTDQATDNDSSNTLQQRSATKEADRLQLQIKQLGNSNTGAKQKKAKNKKKDQTKRPNKAEGATIQVQDKTASESKQQRQNKRSAEESRAPAKKPKLDNSQTAESNKQPAAAAAAPESSSVKGKDNVNGEAATKMSKTAKRKQKKKLQELLKKNASGNQQQQQQQQQKSTKDSQAPPSSTPPKAVSKPGTKLTALQQKMKEKLSGARFRWLNEQLYTTKGDESFKLFQEKPELFDEYHEGFRHQVESWPENPVDIIISQLQELPEGTVIADLGCGDAKIAHTLTRQKVMSFDMIAKNDKVIACDIAKLPLPADFVDVAVFSLALMGTNYLEFLKEAKRVLKPGGELKIAEVVSRFSDVDGFIDLLEHLGFDFVDKDASNKMFIMLYFTKREVDVDEEIDKEMLQGLSKKQKKALRKGAGVSISSAKLQKTAENLLKPCVYKKR
ncbi:methyltransferase domain containing protein [Lichtheimia corymbifera JMRC:FSU:9682]|uniref:Ribosomal RNA-processing protein 8 n=1 Tax=Lichtheimia corymbifera JMRC:FSU:9682 TaxID=1263082 RepID=A0A068RW80_9FUNG|nr:methyltransferase domain containing protein [Lichtheimia corymbifera JMRC:FSU:9682]